MSYLVKLIFLIFISISLISCGERGISEDEKLYIKAKNELDSKNYFEANKLFEKLVKDQPEERIYKQYLADSYLGMGGFELFDFLISIDRILSSSFKTNEFIFEVKKFTEKYFFIGKKRSEYLNTALLIYYDIDNKYEAKTREDKLKKGLVHIFLLTQSLKNLISKFSVKIKNKDNIEELEKEYKRFVKKYIVHIDEMIFHGFRAYLNLKDSFDEVNHLLIELDRAIYVVFGIPYNTIKHELTNMSIEKFIELFIKYNPRLYEEFMKNILKTCKQADALERIILLEKIIKENYRNHQFESEALRVVKKVKSYVEHHNEDVCLSFN